MSESRDILAAVVTERQSWSGDVVRNLRSGERFLAEIQEVPEIELQTDLGRDPRESVLVHVSNRQHASGCRISDMLDTSLHGQTVRLKILSRTNNPTNSQVTFGCQHLTDQDK